MGRLLGAAGLVAYNWWVFVLFEPGWLTSTDGFFSDLSAGGQDHAVLLQRIDMAAGILLLAGLLLRGPIGRDAARRGEWPWLVAFAAAGGIGGRFPYACAAELDGYCRTLERHLDLPWHHYVHMLSGITEFATATIAIWLMYRRAKGVDATEANVARFSIYLMVVAYPVLAVSYVTARVGAFIEPVFFLLFTAALVMELFEPVPPTGPPVSRAERRRARTAAAHPR